MMSLPSRTPVTDGGGIVRRVPSRAIAPQLVPTIIARITGISALILVAISASGLVLTNVMATTATGNVATGLRCAVLFFFASAAARKSSASRLHVHSPGWKTDARNAALASFDPLSNQASTPNAPQRAWPYHRRVSRH